MTEVLVIEVHVKKVVPEVKSVVKDPVEEKISRIENVDTPVLLVRPMRQTAGETEVEKDREGRGVKTEVKRVDVHVAVLLIEKKDPVIKTSQNLQKQGTVLYVKKGMIHTILIFVLHSIWPNTISSLPFEEVEQVRGLCWGIVWPLRLRFTVYV